jgi:hypothetical protein
VLPINFGTKLEVSLESCLSCLVTRQDFKEEKRGVCGGDFAGTPSFDDLEAIF